MVCSLWPSSLTLLLSPQVGVAGCCQRVLLPARPRISDFVNSKNGHTFDNYASYMTAQKGKTKLGMYKDSN